MKIQKRCKSNFLKDSNVTEEMKRNVPKSEREKSKRQKKTSSKEENLENFVLVEASKLSLKNKFMQYKPVTQKEKELKRRLTMLINMGLHDFYCQKYAPSLNEKQSFDYIVGAEPALGKTYKWWKREAEKYLPERKSRLGTKTEYTAFLGYLIKKLVANGWSVGRAWNAVCNDSSQLGNYWDRTTSAARIEATGSREICGFFDLGNTCKLVSDDKYDNEFWQFGGTAYENGFECPLVQGFHYTNPANEGFCSVGWVILEK